MKPLLVSLALALAAASATAAEPVRRIGVYVLPYYAAAADDGGRPQVAVGKAFDERLASDDPAVIAEVEKSIRAAPELVTPMTLMVLAIRLYDVGLRDEAVFWFYAAKDRYATLAAVLDMSHPARAQVAQATRDFAVTAGPDLNGYAFCDLGRQARQRQAALDWVAANPYRALFIDALPARPGDRQAHLEAALAELRTQAARERDALATPELRARVAATREANRMQDKYCW
ncbi:hypothetical protein [Rubrivivax gelatinosus]|uniref:Sel1 repeat family protein n=1 Tax=Rubrivivax gelatinosus TaxID=28068 RepID=A0A4R2M9N8_RUBGE|nr:hypothetical protein [Rubrivivax gelatinosus]MBK1687529.1 hypothetical protein [Rubrivivax gelatinosus]TCP02901.1 hypothetical protein EV684_10567 [Rubrivivax gelatinosus]